MSFDVAKHAINDYGNYFAYFMSFIYSYANRPLVIISKVKVDFHTQIPVFNGSNIRKEKS